MTSYVIGRNKSEYPAYMLLFMASPSTKQQHSPSQQQQQPPRLLGSQDLLSYYNLIPIYDKYVRPYPPPDRGASLDQTLAPYTADLPGNIPNAPPLYSSI